MNKFKFKHAAASTVKPSTNACHYRLICWLFLLNKLIWEFAQGYNCPPKHTKMFMLRRYETKVTKMRELRIKLDNKKVKQPTLELNFFLCSCLTSSPCVFLFFLWTPHLSNQTQTLFFAASDTIFLAHAAVARWRHRLWWVWQQLSRLIPHHDQQAANNPFCFKQFTSQKETYGRKESWSCTSRWGCDWEAQRGNHFCLFASAEAAFHVLRSSTTVFTSGWITNGISSWCKLKSSTGKRKFVISLSFEAKLVPKMTFCVFSCDL